MRGARTLIACLVALLLLAAAPAAEATYDPLASGATVLKLDKGFRALLRDHGVEVATREGAAFKNGALRFPVVGGKFDPTAKKGTVEHGGTVLFERAGHSLSLKKLQLKTTRPSSPIVAKLGGGQLKLGPAERLVVTRPGFADAVAISKLRLSSKFATRLSKRLRLRGVFKQGMLVGSVVTQANPATVTVIGKGKATLELDPGMVAKLDRHFVAVNPVFPAEHVGASFTLPIIVGGKLAPDATAGTLRTGGEIEFLQLGAGQVFWHELWFDVGLHAALAEVDVEPTPAFPGKLGQVPALSFGGGVVASDGAARTIALASAPVALTATTAATFNQAFAAGKEDFAAGELMGTLSFVARGQ